jgi:Mn2+/Fe2+ NRAMP family transporter
MKIKNLINLMGPGLLYAGAAVGVSHLVQSTRAGAMFGWQLLAVVILANVVKYPFFQIGPRYTAATGKTLLDGYANLGRWAVWLFLLMTLGTMFAVQSAVTVVTAGLLDQLTGMGIDVRLEAAMLLVVCAAILIVGRYAFLDQLIKIIIVLLTLTTLVSVIAASFTYTAPQQEIPFTFANVAHITFFCALVGWMPAPLDISVWHSLWSEAKNREREQEWEQAITMKESLLDFNVGYIGTAVLACCFLGLGALVMYGSGEAFPDSATAFAGRLISLYTENLGNWSWPFIAVACFTTMFSTVLTCLDAFSRVLRKLTTQLIPHRFDNEECRKLYGVWVLLIAVGTGMVLYLFLGSMKSLVDFATILSFVVAPLVAVLNYLVMQDKNLPESARLGTGMKLACWLGITVLSGFALYYIYFRLMA